MRSKKKPCQPKQRSDFLAAPFHKAPPGRQKSEREFCLFGGVLFFRRAAPYGRLAVLARLAAVAAACVIGVPACVPCCTWRPGGRLAAIVSAFCGVVFRPTLPLLCLVCAAPGACCRLSAVRRRHRFFCCFFMRSPRKALPFSAGVPLLCSRPACRFSAAFTQTLLCLFVWPALPARHALCVRSSVLFWLSVCLFRVGCTRVFLLSFIFCLFLFGFDLSNFFSLVAQAATGISLLVSSCGFVPGLRVLSPAAFSRTFAPVACFSVLCCSHGFSLLFFTFSCLTFSSQTSFHLSLRPRRASTFFRKESRQRFAKGLRPFEPHSSALRVDLPFPRAAGRLKRPFGPQTAG